MRKVLLLSLFIANVASADPAVGQKAVMEGDVNGTPVTLERTITENLGGGMWTIQSVTTIAGQTATKTEPLRLYTSSEMDEMLAKCALAGGSNEVVTVKAGSFDSCVIETSNFRTAVADVPMGVVMLQMYSGNGSLVLELSSYQK